MAFTPWLKRLLPRTLYGRTLMIVVTPVVLAQLVATFVFFDRHWSTMTTRLSYALAGDIGMIVEMVQADHSPDAVKRLSARTNRQMDLTLDYQPGSTLPTKGSVWPDPLRVALERALDDRLEQSFVVRFRPKQELVDIHIKLPQGLLSVHSPDRRIYTPTTFIFISWMFGSSIVLSIIALMFMRNQIRPIRRLA
ncbi:MAG: hypothetical protein ABL897_02725, partial [Hyphomicrobium sp.]